MAGKTGDYNYAAISQQPQKPQKIQQPQKMQQPKFQQSPQPQQPKPSLTGGEIAKSIGDAVNRNELIDSKDLEMLDADKITRFYRIPSARFKTTDQLMTYYGYKIGDKISEGAFGVIYYATHVKTAIQVACKQIDLNKSKSSLHQDESKMIDMKNELYILKKMFCPYIVKLYCHFVVNNHMYLFIKLANGGNFAKYVKEKGVLTEKEARAFFSQTLVAIEYMHSLSIAHRDIKLENILLLRHPNDRLTVLITDFGLSRVITVDGEHVAMSRTICGTPAYMAPEILRNEPFDAFQADVWALGCALYAMLCADTPFACDESRVQLRRQESRQWKWREDQMAAAPTPYLNSVMRQMLEPDPHTRIRVPAIVIHNWCAAEYRYWKRFFGSSNSANNNNNNNNNNNQENSNAQAAAYAPPQPAPQQQQAQYPFQQ